MSTGDKRGGSAAVPRDRFPALDGLRAIGAIAVLTTHVGFSSGAAVIGPFAGFLARLDSGVAIFFVVSGFLLYRPHVIARLDGVSSPALGRYLWHRALRILPVAWIAVVLAATLVGGASPVQYARVVTMTQIYFDGLAIPGLTQMWSLSTEVAFYLVLPIFALAVGRVRNNHGLRGELVFLGGLPLVSCVWWIVESQMSNGHLGLWLPGYLGWFGAGMALAVWNAGRSRGVFARGPLDILAEAPGTAWAASAAIFLIAATPVAGPFGLASTTPANALFKNVLYGVFAFLVMLPAVAASHRPSLGLRALARGPLAFLGRVSYGIFAYHLALLSVIERLIGHRPFDGHFGLLWLLTMAASVGLASASFYWVERPLMRKGRRHESGANTTAATTTVIRA